VYDLSVALLTRLPREIRDQVYAQIPDCEAMKEVVATYSNSWDLVQGPTAATDAWPEFLKPNVLDTQVKNEIVQAFCERNRGFRAEDFRLWRLLSHPVFGTPITLGASVISSLTVKVSIFHCEEFISENFFKSLESCQPLRGVSARMFYYIVTTT
jgi:hypothetical protein